MKSLNKKVSKAVSALVVAIALVGCDSGGGSNGAALALAGLGGGDTAYAKASIAAKVRKGDVGSDVALSTGTAATATTPETRREVVLVRAGISKDFTTTASGAGSSAPADNGDFGFVLSVPSANATVSATVYTLRELTCDELDKSRTGTSAAAWTSDPTAGRCGLFDSGVAASSARIAEYNAILDNPANYTVPLGTFDFAFSIDSSDPNAVGTVTIANEAGVHIVAANGQTSVPFALVTVTGVYSNPNATVGEDVCDSVGSPTIIQGNINSPITLGKYTLLRGTVFVNNVKVTVPKGSVIYGERGSSLFFKGGELETKGTAAEPVCFTSAQRHGSRFPGDWGGIVFIGNGNATRTSTTEGTTPQTYPGANSMSVKLRYTIVEFAGNEVAPGDELNSLSQYAVNTIDYKFVQAHRGLDDSFEWWGGGKSPSTHDMKFMIGSGSMDDDFDMDEGFSGNLQYLVSIKYPKACGGSASTDPHGFEMDGRHSSTCTNTQNPATTDCSNPTVANFTTLGLGISGGAGMRAREGLLGTFTEGLIYGFATRINAGEASGFSNTISNITVISDSAPDTLAASASLTLSATASLTSIPVTDIGSVQDAVGCGFGTKPDLRTSASVSSGNTGGVPLNLSATVDSVSVPVNWPAGWTVWRAR
ncbi:hypothetical protein EHQ52_13105 [Leptospira koniambonensis]|uniref:Lipoprotein n=1 Tax=Leptospira koniambonensis TaxID=2484950 RepID=A0A4R9J9C3_9LEPT|nr:hypothetical protein [Leptospira koniambonensis]TGL35396.1 hypothetical protein EHQ52_13105 [Leptospira koniambonensis]